MGAFESSTVLQRIASGEPGALAELYDRFAGLVHGLSLRILRDPADAEDVVQEVFVQVWRQAGSFDPGRGSLQAWLCMIARSRALDRLRRRSARREDPEDEAPAPGDSPTPEHTLAVRKALLALPEEQRRALELAYYEGLTQSEIAQRLGHPLGTVKTRIRSAMIRLREVLEPA